MKLLPILNMSFILSIISLDSIPFIVFHYQLCLYITSSSFYFRRMIATIGILECANSFDITLWLVSELYDRGVGRPTVGLPCHILVTLTLPASAYSHIFKSICMTGLKLWLESVEESNIISIPSLVPIEEVEEWRRCMLPSFSTNSPILLIQLFHPCLWGWEPYLPPGSL